MMGFPREAIDLYVDMLLSGLMPDQFTLSGVISACTKLESLSLGQQLHLWVIRSGLALGPLCRVLFGGHIFQVCG